MNRTEVQRMYSAGRISRTEALRLMRGDEGGSMMDDIAAKLDAAVGLSERCSRGDAALKAMVEESKSVKGSYHGQLVDERGTVQWRDMTPRSKSEAMSLAQARLKATSRSDAEDLAKGAKTVYRRCTIYRTFAGEYLVTRDNTTLMHDAKSLAKAKQIIDEIS